jgi:hypothetical protein
MEQVSIGVAPEGAEDEEEETRREEAMELEWIGRQHASTAAGACGGGEPSSSSLEALTGGGWVSPPPPPQGDPAGTKGSARRRSDPPRHPQEPRGRQGVGEVSVYGSSKRDVAGEQAQRRGRRVGVGPAVVSWNPRKKVPISSS